MNRRTFKRADKVRGESAVREMSPSARRGYEETDPLAVYMTAEGDCYIEDCDGISGPIPLVVCEMYLEAIASEPVS